MFRPCACSIGRFANGNRSQAEILYDDYEKELDEYNSRHRDDAIYTRDLNKYPPRYSDFPFHLREQVMQNHRLGLY